MLQAAAEKDSALQPDHMNADGVTSCHHGRHVWQQLRARFPVLSGSADSRQLAGRSELRDCDRTLGRSWKWGEVRDCDCTLGGRWDWGEVRQIIFTVRTCRSARRRCNSQPASANCGMADTSHAARASTRCVSVLSSSDASRPVMQQNIASSCKRQPLKGTRHIVRCRGQYPLRAHWLTRAQL